MRAKTLGMTDSISSSIPSDSDVASVVATALERAPKPLPIPQILKALTGPYKISKDRLRAVLQTLQTDGKAFVWGTAKTPAYWNRDAVALCRAAILDAVKIGPASESELKKTATKAVAGIAPRFSSIFNALVAEKIIHAHPPATKRGRPKYASEPFKPPSLDDRIFAKLKTKRLDIPALFDAMKPAFPDVTAAEIADALTRLEKAERAFRHPPTKKGGACVWRLEPPTFEKELAPLAALEKSRAAPVPNRVLARKQSTPRSARSCRKALPRRRRFQTIWASGSC